VEAGIVLVVDPVDDEKEDLEKEKMPEKKKGGSICCIYGSATLFMILHGRLFSSQSFFIGASWHTRGVLFGLAYLANL